MPTTRRPSLLAALVLSAALALSAAPARAEVTAGHLKIGFLVDVGTGVALPVSDSDYKNLADPSFKFALRAGVVLYLHPKFGFAPELEFDWIPINSNDKTFDSNPGVDARFHRVRFLAGGRFIVPFGIGSFYARLALGVDHITGNVKISYPIPIIGGTVGTNVSLSSTAFTIEPGLGVQFNVVKHLVLGFFLGFPIAPNHDFGSGNSSHPFTAVDVDLLAIVGARF
jgi:hypothetical protein